MFRPHPAATGTKPSTEKRHDVLLSQMKTAIGITAVVFSLPIAHLIFLASLLVPEGAKDKVILLEGRKTF